MLVNYTFQMCLICDNADAKGKYGLYHLSQKLCSHFEIINRKQQRYYIINKNMYESILLK